MLTFRKRIYGIIIVMMRNSHIITNCCISTTKHNVLTHILSLRKYTVFTYVVIATLAWRARLQVFLATWIATHTDK